MPRTRRDRPVRKGRQSAAAVCPQCGAEFVAGVETCSDCHVGLVAPVAPAERSTSPEGLVPIGGTFSPGFGRTLVETFDRAGIAHHFQLVDIEREGEFGSHYTQWLCAYVRPEDEHEAERLYARVASDPTGGPPNVSDTPNLTDSSESGPGAPRLRDLMVSDMGPPEPPHRNVPQGYLLHAMALAGWLVVMYQLAEGQVAFAMLAAAVALALHTSAAIMGRDWRREWTAQAEAERREVEATDWEAIEEQQRRDLESAQRPPAPEPAEDRRQSGEAAG